MTRLIKFAPVFVVMATVGGLGAATSTSRFDKLPISFEPNRGQADPEAQFVARGAGYYLTLGRSGSRILLRNNCASADVHMGLTGANRRADVIGDRALPGHSSYFHGNDSSKWITNLPNYGQVTARGVYPGIDMVYYGNQAQLEYDFVVAPQADPTRIRIHFDGVKSLTAAPSGDLILNTAAGDLLEHKPVVYQNIAGTRRMIEAGFHITGAHDITFKLGKYDRSQPLVIDPVLVYSSFLGGRDLDAVNSVAADSSGNMYLTGTTFSTPKGDADVMIRKISADGSAFLYIADLGGADNDYGNGIAVDVNGFAAVAGRTASLDFPVVSAFQSKNYGVNNAYILRLDPAGTTLIFSTYLGGNDDDRAYAVALDRQGSVYLTGVSFSNDFPTNDGAFQRNNLGGADAFVAKFASDGSAIYSTLIGGKSDDRANAIAVDASGNASIVGETFSDSFPQANAPFQHSRHGGLEAFVTEVNADGSQLVFSTFMGGAGDDSASGVAIDLSGNIYVAGSTTGDNGFDIPNRSFNTSYNGGSSDIFVSKFSANGQSLLWTTFLGSHGGDYGDAVSVDANGNVYVAGNTDSNQYPVTRDAFQGNRGGGVDGVLSVLDTNGQNLLYSTFYGGSGDDDAVSVAVNQFFEVFLAGQTASGDFPVVGALQRLAGGGPSDGFFAKFSFAGASVPGTNNTPVTFLEKQAPASMSNFGRGMIAVESEGKFQSAVETDGSIAAPERFERMGRPLNGGRAVR